jgi:hypothetical protein
MLKTKLSGLTISFLLFVAMISRPIHATTLDTLITTNGTVTQGNLVFSNFQPNALTDATTIDVTGFTEAGVTGLRFSSLPVATQFAQSTVGGGGGGGAAAREAVFDIAFTVTVTDPSFVIHSVVQRIDPAALAIGNALIRNLTGVPAGAPTTTLFSCIAGDSVPSASVCPAPVDSFVLNANASTIDVDRQIQILVGQKGGATLVGNAGAAFFDVAFPEISCSPLTGVNIVLQGAAAVCPGGTGGTATVTDIGGGAAATQQWGYRTTSGGPISELFGQTGPTYLLSGTDFPSIGSYLLVCTTSSPCGAPFESNEIPITITSGPPTPTIIGLSSFCAGTTVTLTSSSPIGNLWSTGETTQSIVVADSGSFTVTFFDAAGCFTTSAPFVVALTAAPVTPTISGPSSFCPGTTVKLTSSSPTGNLWSTGATTQSISVSAPGSFSVTVGSGTCSATSAPFAVTASPAATTPTITGPASFCAGGSVTLTSSAATGNLWSTGATTQSITVSAAGSYSVTATNAAGCPATSAPFTVAADPLPPTPTISGPASICAGTSITLTSSSATGNLWSTGATTQSITVAAGGSFSVTVTNAGGCTATSAAFVVTANAPPPTPTITGPATLCAGSTITLTSSAATGNLWSTGATTQSITVSAAGSFAVTVTAASGCKAASSPFAVTASATPPTPTISGPASICAGTPITLTSSAATGNLWSTGATTQSITVAAAGSFTVTVTNAAGCSATSAAKAVTASPAAVTPTITGPASFCPGTSITLTSSAATGNLWSTGATTQSITVSAAGSFTVTATNAGGCSATSAAKVITATAAPATPTITGPATFCLGTSITLTSSAATGNLWSTGATTQSITVTAAGSFTVSATNAAGCSATSAAKVVTANPAQATPTITGPASICAGAPITLTSSSATGNLWSTGATTQSITVSAAGSFTVTVTNASGCSATSAAKVIATSPAVPTPTITGPASFCPGASITLTSSSATGNLWSTGATTQSISVTAAGSYSVTVTNASGCTATSAAFAVTAKPAPATPTITGPSAFCPGATITLTSSSATGNLWSTGATTQSITVSTAGSFTVTVTDAGGCSATSAAFAVAASPAQTTPTISGPSTFCAGATITLTSSSATGNLWSTGATTQSITVSAAGSFSVTVTNASGCQAASAAFVVTADPGPAKPTITGPASLSCAGGSITLTSSSATGNLWSTGETTQSIAVSTAGTFTVTVTNAGGCSATSAAFAVTATAAQPTPTISGPGSFCAGATITLTSSSATGNLWSTGATTQSITVSAAGSYTVSVAGTGGCSATSAPFVVTANPAAATPTISGPTSFCLGNSVTLTSSSATGNLWSTGATTQSINVSAAGSYSVTVTSASGCQATSAPFVVTASPAVATPTISGPAALSCAGGAITLTSSSATGNLWSNGATTQSIDVSAAGSYTVTVTNDSGCSSTSGPFLVAAASAPATPTIAGPASLLCGGGAITLTSSSPTGNLWSTGATTQSIAVSAAGSYTVTVTDAGGCSATSDPFAVAPASGAVTPTVTGPTTFCPGSTITLTSSSATGNRWSTGATTQSIVVSTAGSFTVTVTSAGCSSTSVAHVVTSLAAAATNSGPVCAGGTILLSTPFISGARYDWTGPGNFKSAVQSPTISNASTANAGTYTLKVTAGSCSTQSTTTVSVTAAPAKPVIKLTAGTNPSTAGASATLDAGIFTTYLWSTGETTRTITVSPSVTTTYTVTGANGACSSAATSFVLTVNGGGVTPTISGPTSFCPGASIVLTSSSAIGNTWSTGATTQSITVSVAGSYTVTVAGLTSAARIVTANPTPVAPTVSGATSFCTGGSVTLTSSAATGNLWSTGATTQSITVSAAGSYSVTVTNASGCKAISAPFAVAENPGVTTPPIISGPTSFCAGDTITLTSSYALGNLWSTGETTQSISVSAAGSYSVTMTNASGCSATSAAFDVIANPLPETPAISGGTSFCTGDTIVLTSSSLTGNLWSTGETTQSIVVSVAGTYSVSVTNPTGCSASSVDFVVVENALPVTPVISGVSSFCPGSSTTLTSSSATGNLWSTGETTQSITVSVAGAYTVTVSNDSGCSATSDAFNVIANAAPATPVISGPSTFCPGTSITLTSSSPTGNRWSTGATTQSIVVSAGGSFTVTVTNAGGCSTTSAPRVVTQFAAPIATNSGPGCPGSSIQLSATSIAGATYSWSGPHGFRSTVQNPLLTAVTTGNTPGVYTVTITGGPCGSSTSSTTVVVNATCPVAALKVP